MAVTKHYKMIYEDQDNKDHDDNGNDDGNNDDWMHCVVICTSYNFYNVQLIVQREIMISIGVPLLESSNVDLYLWDLGFHLDFI